MFIIGLMDHLANLRINSFSQTSCFMSRIIKQKLIGISLQLPMEKVKVMV